MLSTDARFYTTVKSIESKAKTNKAVIIRVRSPQFRLELSYEVKFTKDAVKINLQNNDFIDKCIIYIVYAYY